MTALVDGGLDGVTPALTRPRRSTWAVWPAIASDPSRRPIKRVVVSDADYRAILVGRGVPDATAGILVGLFAAARRGDFAATDPTMARLLGRAPTSLHDALKPIVHPESSRA